MPMFDTSVHSLWCHRHAFLDTQSHTACQVVRLERNPHEHEGMKKWKISLPQPFRMHWLEDVVYSPEWRELISDFDRKRLGTLISDFDS